MPVARTTILIYALSGFLAVLSGIVFSIYTSAGYSLATVGVEFDAIAAVVIGGTLLTGGSGFVAGTLIGVLIMWLIQTYIIFDGTLSSWWTKIVIGLLLFAFIVLQKGLLRFAARRIAATEGAGWEGPDLLRTAISSGGTRNSHAMVVDEIGRSIVGGDFATGAILPGDAELAERFKVSRTVLREVMKTLAAKGLVIAKARIGTKVTERRSWNYFDADLLRWHLETGFDDRFLRHLTEMRLSFEPSQRAWQRSMPSQTISPACMMRPRQWTRRLRWRNLPMPIWRCTWRSPKRRATGSCIPSPRSSRLRSSPVSSSVRPSVEVVIEEGRDRVLATGLLDTQAHATEWPAQLR